MPPRSEERQQRRLEREQERLVNAVLRNASQEQTLRAVSERKLDKLEAREESVEERYATRLVALRARSPKNERQAARFDRKEASLLANMAATLARIATKQARVEERYSERLEAVAERRDDFELPRDVTVIEVVEQALPGVSGLELDGQSQARRRAAAADACIVS